MIYVLSDIHGNKENFDSILEKINLRMEDSLYILGDVIDRYPYGIQLLQQIIEMPNAHMLLGNHEWMMMKALGICYQGTGDLAGKGRICQSREPVEDLLSHWYENDGGVTHEAWKKLSGEEQERMGSFLSTLPLSYDVSASGKNFKLVHAAPVELYRHFPVSPYEDAVEFAVWDREMFHYNFNIGYTVVFGHTATCYMQDQNPLEIWDAGDMIGIDCGSGFPKSSGLFPVEGRLACLRLDDMQAFYSKEECRSRHRDMNKGLWNLIA